MCNDVIAGEPGMVAPSSPKVRPHRAPQLSIIVPTFNETANMPVLLARLDALLADMAYEVIVVDDDSPDGTAALVRQLSISMPQVRCLQRIKRRGLSSACIEGMLASSAPVLAVMDADLQHDERLLVPMLEAITGDRADIVIGSRYLADRPVGVFNAQRAFISRAATRLSRMMFDTEITDPMSGFFMLRRELFEACVRDLSGLGFKILLDILSSAPKGTRKLELPFEFRERHAGESKLDSQAAQDFFLLLIEKRFGRLVPPRFIMFGLVGGTGVLIHMAILFTMLLVPATSFVTAQTVATLGAMTFNYALNNELTFRDHRQRGLNWFKGWASFTLACSIGAIANVGIAAQLFNRDFSIPLAALGGIAVGAVWNYAVTAVYTWKLR